MKLRLTKELKTGLLVITATVLLIWGINFLKGKNLFDSSIEFYTVYPNVNGLAESSYVYINGYKVGYIKAINYDPLNPDRFTVKLSLKNEVLVPKGSIAEIFSIDIMGTRAIRIMPSKSNTFHTEQDTLIGSTEGDLKEMVSEEIRPLKNKAESLIGQFDSVLVTLQTIFNEQAVENLRNSFTSIHHTIKNLESTTGVMDTLVSTQSINLSHIIGNLDSLTSTMSHSRHNISSMIKNLDKVSGSLATVNYKSLLANIDSTINSVNTITNRLKNGEGSLGLLINDEELYDNLTQAAANLEKLTLDFHQNPRRYLHLSALDFGKTVYIDKDGKRKKVKDTTESPQFKVLVKIAKEPVLVNRDNFKYSSDITETKIKNNYYYTIGDFVTFKDCNVYLEKIISDYPQAYIIAVRNGKLLKLEKAMRKSNY